MKYLLGLLALPATLVALWAGYTSAQLLGGPDPALSFVAVLYAGVAIGGVACLAVCVAGWEIATQIETSRAAAELRFRAEWQARHGTARHGA